MSIITKDFRVIDLSGSVGVNTEIISPCTTLNLLICAMYRSNLESKLKLEITFDYRKRVRQEILVQEILNHYFACNIAFYKGRLTCHIPGVTCSRI